MGRIWKVLTRKKAIDPVTAEETRLSRVLNTFDLTALGVGSTLGVGVYVLAGQVARTTAGPSVVLSFLIAAIASVFAGLCYAEFGARAPRAGSAYIYSYVCVGEFIAFVIGWNLILEYVIGSASVARGLSLYLDTLINNTLQDAFREIAPIHVAYLAPYFDFFSFGISILLAIALAFGLKESSMVNNIVTGLNLLVVLFIIVAGSIKADPANWRISPNSTNSTKVGDGGFFPFGVEGMIRGAATCFYGFVGFDCIATTGEEVKNPRKAIPISIVVSLLIIFLAYFGVATVLTLMVPFYMQDLNAPIPRAFEMMGWDAAKWIVAIGALFGLCASLFGAMFPLPRIIYAMGSDGLVFKFLAKVHPRFQTPVIGTILAGLLTGLMSALFDLSQLVNMMSIGTLQAYTIVAASVLLLRYQEEAKKVYVPIKTSSDTESVSSESSVDEKYNDDGIRQNFDGPSTSDEQELIINESTSFSRSFRSIINYRAKEPNRISENIVAVEVFLYCCLCVGIGLCVMYWGTNILNGETLPIVITSIIVGLTIIILVSLFTQPKSKKELSFKVPLVPLIPALSILVNIYLMLMLDYKTWVRFAVWMAVGVPMYCICACTDKTPLKAQNGTNYSTNITNGHTKMSNGIPNPTFVQSETSEQGTKGRTTRKKPAPPPPPSVEQRETIEVQQEAVIAQLDEILEKEVAIAQLDDVLNDETIRINDRRFSAGALSDLSTVASHSEDVVADVHCANVVTPVADPQSLPFPTVSDVPLNLDADKSELTEISDKSKPSEPTVEIPVPTEIVIIDNLIQTGVTNPTEDNASNISTDNHNDDNITSSEPVVPAILSVENPIEPGPSSAAEHNVKPLSVHFIEESMQSLRPKSDEICPKTYDAATSDEPLEKVVLTSEALDKGIEAAVNAPIISSAHNLEKEIPNMGSVDAQDVSKNVEQNSITKTKEESEYLQKPPVLLLPLESVKKSVDEPVLLSPVPNKEALKTVTLRHVKKQIKKVEPTENQNASDDNLKPGSSEYRNFVKDLNSKLTKTAVFPSFYVAPRKDLGIPPKEVLPNENVIEDNIDRIDAKEKLKAFYAARNSAVEGENKLPTEETAKPVLYGSTSIDESLLKSENETERSKDESHAAPSDTADLKPISEIIKSLTNSGLEDHKLKMENVFNSIKLKNVGPQGEAHLKRRLSKSLGRGFIKDTDKSEHKQKMDDIFHTIKLMRKESLRAEKGNDKIE